MNASQRNVIAKYWQFISLVTVIALAVMLTPAQEPRRTLTLPLGSTGLTYGQGLRATLTNLGNQRVNAQIRILDSEGTVLKQEALVLEPNQMCAVALSRAEVGGREASALLRAEAVVAETDAPQLWLTGEVLNWATGSTEFVTTANRGPLMGSNQNHNETLVRDQR